jgi:hypothetical protein
MKDLPACHFFVVNRDRKISLRYVARFIPRIGDTIVIGKDSLQVTDVVIETAQDNVAGIQHSLYVHVKEVTPIFGGDDYEELELNQFCERMKQR